MGIYVETLIRAEMDELWRFTQSPDLHARWDLRFTEIEYLPRVDESQVQQFRYVTRIGFGLKVCGEGETVGERVGPDQRTSALKFWSDDFKSLIKEGSGYWRYVPTAGGIRFFTWYDYRVRFGLLGRVFDRLMFRPLLGWATAWSFDRLRLWIEKGIDPAVSLLNSAVHALARTVLAFVWIYQGVVPKLWFAHADELQMLQLSGIPSDSASTVLQLVGWAELALGLGMLMWFHQRWHFLLTILLMIVAFVSVAVSAPQFLVAAFNPVSLNMLMIAVALVGWLVSKELPAARRCLRRPPKERT